MTCGREDVRTEEMYFVRKRLNLDKRIVEIWECVPRGGGLRWMVRMEDGCSGSTDRENA